MDVNDMMVDEVKPLYMRPYGGLAILEFIGKVRQLFDRWPGDLDVVDYSNFINTNPD